MGRGVAVVPARDEAERIGDTVRALREVGLDVIVVDDASTDATAAIADQAGAQVITLARRSGKGGALAAGLAKADAEIIVLIDADLGSSASIAGALLERIESGEADLAIGAPPREGTSGFGVVEMSARLAVRALCGRNFSRPLSGQRAARSEVLRDVRIASGFGVEVAMSIDAVRLGYRVEEVPLSFTHARTGRDVAGFRHRIRQGGHILRALMSCAVKPRRRGRKGQAWQAS